MRTGLIIGLAVAAVAGGAAYWYYNKEIKILENSVTYKIIGFQIGTVTKQTTQVFLTLRIFSNSTLDADIQEMYTDIYFNGILVGNFQNLEKFVLPAKGYSDAKITVTFSPEQIAIDAIKLAESFLDTKNFAIKAQGYVKLKLFGLINTTVPFTYDTTLHEILQPTVT